jgi:hypothetical protein
MPRSPRPLDPVAADGFRRAFPDGPPPRAIRTYRLRRGAGSHRLVVAEDADAQSRRLLLKAPVIDGESPAVARWWLDAMRREYQVLTEVAPRIVAREPVLGCPRAYALDPASGTPPMEFVDGPLLSELLYGVRPVAEGARLAILLERCGEWGRGSMP